MPDLRAALQTIHADKAWWRKILVGGAWWLLIVGWPMVEGHQLESIENSQRGYPTPLPRWNDLSDKAIIGIFALVIDFFYFLFPLLIGGMVLFCGTLAAGLAAGEDVARLIAIVTLSVMGLYLFGAWAVGASPVAKQRYVSEGELGEVMGSALVRELLRPPVRALYLRARLLSTPLYLLAVALLMLSFWVFPLTVLGGLVVVWIGLSALVYARLVTIQLYLAATTAAETKRWEMSRA